MMIANWKSFLTKFQECKGIKVFSGDPVAFSCHEEFCAFDINDQWDFYYKYYYDPSVEYYRHDVTPESEIVSISIPCLFRFKGNLKAAIHVSLYIHHLENDSASWHFVRQEFEEGYRPDAIDHLCQETSSNIISGRAGSFQKFMETLRDCEVLFVKLAVHPRRRELMENFEWVSL